MRKANIIILIIILLSFAIAIYIYPQMPDKMASHWNTKGEVDGYMSKLWGVFLMPVISIALFLMFILIPKIDPLKKNIDKFRKYYDGFIVLIILFLCYIYGLSIAWNLGTRFNMASFIIPSLGILFYYIGILLENCKRNWFIGIRTPWTLSNETVWKKTHKIGGKLFRVAGILALLGAVFQRFAILLAVVPVICIALYTIVYSYFEYQKQVKK